MTHTSGQSPRGVVLVLAMVFVAALSVLMLSFSSLTMMGNNGVYAIQSRVQARAMADVAIADEMKRMNSGNPVPIPVSIATSAWGPTGSASADAQQAYYVDPPVSSVLSNGHVAIRFLAHGLVSKTQIGVNGFNQLKVHLEAVAEYIPGTPSGTFPNGAFGKTSTTVNGGSSTDSYDSSLGTSYYTQAGSTDPNTAPTAAQLAAYHATAAGSGGNIGSNGPIFGVGTITVFGNATPGPGQTVNLSGGAQVTGATSSEISAAILPDFVYAVPSGATEVGAITSSTTLADGNFHITNVKMASSDNLTLNGVVNLYVDNDFSFSGNSTITLGAGAQVVVYQSANGKVDISGNGFIGPDHKPSNFAILSLGPSASVVGNGTFYGTVYAPNADAAIKGNGDAWGAIIGNTVSISGGGMFHWDKSAKSPAFKTNPKAVLRLVREVLLPNDSVSFVTSGFGS